MPKSASELPSSEVVADPANESGQRRRFTVDDKQRILTAADACTERGQLSALLRQERIYSSQLNTWRRQLRAEGVAGLENAPAGRRPQQDAKDRLIDQLQQEKAKLEKQLRLKDDLLALQKKTLSLLDHLQDATTR